MPQGRHRRFDVGAFVKQRSGGVDRNVAEVDLAAERPKPPLVDERGVDPGVFDRDDIAGLDQRVAFDEEIASIRASDDPYRLRRETYLAQRRRDIAELRGEPISERDRLWLEELEALKAAPDAAAPAPEAAAAPVEPPANPESLLITQPR
jgi:hypothetical protein